jgi:Transposase, Mutator family
VDNASRKDVTSFPKEHWRQLWSNNSLERLNKEIRRRTDVVGIFPDRPSIVQDTREQSLSVLHLLTLCRDCPAMKSLQMRRFTAPAPERPSYFSWPS